MPREYEIIFVLQPDLPEEEREKLIGQSEQWISSSGGEVVHVERMGTRKLAYRIEGHREGFYVLLKLKGEGELVKQIERRLKVTDPVIKYLSVRIDETNKKIEKLRLAREKREARRKPKVRPNTAAEAV